VFGTEHLIQLYWPQRKAMQSSSVLSILCSLWQQFLLLPSALQGNLSAKLSLAGSHISAMSLDCVSVSAYAIHILDSGFCAV
jgi:hypothetical protein